MINIKQIISERVNKGIVRSVVYLEGEKSIEVDLKSEVETEYSCQKLLEKYNNKHEYEFKPTDLEYLIDVLTAATTIKYMSRFKRTMRVVVMYSEEELITAMEILSSIPRIKIKDVYVTESIKTSETGLVSRTIRDVLKKLCIEEDRHLFDVHFWKVDKLRKRNILAATTLEGELVSLDEIEEHAQYGVIECLGNSNIFITNKGRLLYNCDEGICVTESKDIDYSLSHYAEQIFRTRVLRDSGTIYLRKLRIPIVCKAYMQTIKNEFEFIKCKISNETLKKFHII